MQLPTWSDRRRSHVGKGGAVLVFTAAATRAEKMAASVGAECKLNESWCALCEERLRGRHTHPSQWSRELQQFLHQYSSIDMTRCVCRPCDSDLRRGLRGKYPVGQAFTPRWLIREEKKKGKQNPLCCIPQNLYANVEFATFDTICNAVEVSTSIAEGSTVSPFPLCTPHYKSVYKYCHPSPKCVCCGKIQKHQVSLTRFRQCTDPMKVETYLKETGCLEERLTHGALLCIACEVFFNRPSNNYLSESNESIIKELNKKVCELKQDFEVELTECTSANCDISGGGNVE